MQIQSQLCTCTLYKHVETNGAEGNKMDRNGMAQEVTSAYDQVSCLGSIIEHDVTNS